jgi:hypothetical protein
VRKTDTQRYRCTFHPQTTDGYAVQSESGVLPYRDVEAVDAEAAARLAHQRTGCAIVETMRLEGPKPRVKATPAPAKSTRPIVLVTGAAMLAALLQTGCAKADDTDYAGLAGMGK